MHTLLCVYPPRVESLFPPVLLKSYNQIPLAFKVWFSRNSSCCAGPPVGKPDVGLRTFTPVGGLLWYMCSPVCESPTQQLSNLILLWLRPLLLSHCGFSCVFGCGVSFLVSSSVFLSMIVQQLVVILVLSQEGVRARPSTLPSWTNLSKCNTFLSLPWILFFIGKISNCYRTSQNFVDYFIEKLCDWRKKFKARYPLNML